MENTAMVQNERMEQRESQRLEKMTHPKHFMFKLKKGNIQVLSFIQGDQHVKVEKEATLAGNEREVSNNSNIRKQQY